LNYLERLVLVDYQERLVLVGSGKAKG